MGETVEKIYSEIRNGQRDLGFAITQGFSATAFQAQQDKCDILRAGQDNTQRIVSSIRNEPEDWQNRDGSRCYYRGQWKNGNLRYS